MFDVFDYYLSMKEGKENNGSMKVVERFNKKDGSLMFLFSTRSKDWYDEKILYLKETVIPKYWETRKKFMNIYNKKFAEEYLINGR